MFSFSGSFRVQSIMTLSFDSTVELINNFDPFSFVTRKQYLQSPLGLSLIASRCLLALNLGRVNHLTAISQSECHHSSSVEICSQLKFTFSFL